MARLRVQERAVERGVNLSALQAEIIKRSGKTVPLGTLRRYWHSTKNGNKDGEAIELVDVYLLGTIAHILGVPLADLLNEDELGQMRATAQTA